MKYTAKFIDTSLRKYYEKQALYLSSNIYAFHNRYKETDLLVVKSSNKYCYDIEVKVSKADFKADFKKVYKHSILEHGYYKNPHASSIKVAGKRKRVPAGRPVEVKDRPHRFYFAVPEGLVTKEEVPAYAGLLYIDAKGGVTKIKESKLLHKHKLNIDKMLCRKFYFYWLNTKEALEKVKKELKNCKKPLK